MKLIFFPELPCYIETNITQGAETLFGPAVHVPIDELVFPVNSSIR